MEGAGTDHWDSLLGQCMERGAGTGQRRRVRRHCKSPCLGKFQLLPKSLRTFRDVLKIGVSQVHVDLP